MKSTMKKEYTMSDTLVSLCDIRFVLYEMLDEDCHGLRG